MSDDPGGGLDPASWIGDVVRFWFALDRKQWWATDPAIDEQIRERFLKLWELKRALPANCFTDTPESALAAVLLFDQFPRNMMRGHADQFSTDTLSLGVATAAVNAKLDMQLAPAERGFLYMPFQHSESRDVQQRSMILFTALGDADLLHDAQLHHDIIARFGRFPHRNAMLGRAPRADEIAASETAPWLPKAGD